MSQTVSEAEKWAIVDELLDFYKTDSQYGVESSVTQMEHACQAAKRAADSSADEDTIVAALLHDIGWKLAMSAPVDRDMDGGGNLVSNESLAAKLHILSVCNVAGESSLEEQRAQHDVIGATFLRMKGFKDKIPHLIEGHVMAKRYLCFKDDSYRARLSEGSQRTLAFQGGAMDAAEAALFEKDSLFENCMTMRRWDEESKVSGLHVPSMQSYRDMIFRAICRPSCSAQAITGTFRRDGNKLIGYY